LGSKIWSPVPILLIYICNVRAEISKIKFKSNKEEAILTASVNVEVNEDLWIDMNVNDCNDSGFMAILVSVETS
jgi:hypothetical protein